MSTNSDPPHPLTVVSMLLLTIPSFLGIALLIAYPYDIALAMLVAAYALASSLYTRIILGELRSYTLHLLHDLSSLQGEAYTSELEARINQAWRSWVLVLASLGLAIPHATIIMLSRMHSACTLSSHVLVAGDRFVKTPSWRTLRRVALALSMLVVPGAALTALYYKRLRSCMMVARAFIVDLQERGASRSSLGHAADNVHGSDRAEQRRDTTPSTEDLDSSS